MGEERPRAGGAAGGAGHERALQLRHGVGPGRDRVRGVQPGGLSGYLVNDGRDVEADLEHPTKRFRPIAAGVVPEWLAYTLSLVLGVASLAIAWLLTPNLALVMAVYIGMQPGDGARPTHQAVMD